MKIYDKDKIKELQPENCDLEKGYFKTVMETIHHDAIEGIEEQGHYETICEYENGGKDVEWVVDIEGVIPQEAWDEVVSYQLYIPYSETYLLNESIKKQIKKLQDELASTDFKVLKYVEGWYTEEQFAPIKAERQHYRDLINELNLKIRPEVEDE